MGLLAWIFGVLAGLAGIITALSDWRASLIIFLIAALLLPPVTRLLRLKLNLTPPPKAKAILITGLLLALGITSSTHDAAQQRARERAAQHTLRQRAESLLASVLPRGVPQLPDSTLGFLAKWTDSTTDSTRRSAVITEWQVRKARRLREKQAQAQAQAKKVEQAHAQDRRVRAQAETERQRAAHQRRVENLPALARAFRFSDGSQCGSTGPDNVETLLRDHPEWSDNDLVKVACKAIWIGMSEGQLLASRGRPEHINRDVFPTGVHEQWVYGDFGPYIYLDHGIVTSYQTTRD